MTRSQWAARLLRPVCWLQGHVWHEFAATYFRDYVPADENHGNIYGGGQLMRMVICARCLKSA